MASQTRQQMVLGARSSIARRGVSATSFSDVMAETGAPRGSIYYHFPRGKEELVAAAMDSANDFLLGRLARQLETGKTPSALTVTKAFLEAWRTVLTATELQAGCTVAAVVVDGELGLRAHAGEIFAGWRARLAELLQAGGLPKRDAPAVALLQLAAVEGALVLARAEESLEIYDDIAKSLVADVRRRLAAQKA